MASWVGMIVPEVIKNALVLGKSSYNIEFLCGQAQDARGGELIGNDKTGCWIIVS
jgi:hypothetical protein